MVEADHYRFPERHMVTIGDLMPQQHFLRKLEAALDLSFVYEETAPLYSKSAVVRPSTRWSS